MAPLRSGRLTAGAEPAGAEPVRESAAGVTTAGALPPAGGFASDRLPRWPWISGWVVCLLGLGVAGYLTYEHFTGSTSLSCPAGSSHGAIDCLKVTTSVYSVQHGVPVAVLGLVFFAVMAALQSPWAWRSPLLAVKAARIVWCVVGVATALDLVYDELYRIDAICLWCTSVHILTLVLFVTTVFGTLAVSSSSTGGYRSAGMMPGEQLRREGD